MSRSARGAVVICLAMVLLVGLVGGLTAIVSALVVPMWLLAALIVISCARLPDAARRLTAAPVFFSVGLRAPPARLPSPLGC